MSIYLIHAFEDMYSGLHGIEDYALLETNSIKSVEAEGREMSLEVMESYSSIGEELYAQAYDQASAEGFDEDSMEFDGILEDCYNENIAYEYWKLSDEHTYEEYENMLNESNGEWEEIRDKYAVE